MKSRDYTKQIEIWESQEVDDGYGGTTPTEVKITPKWAKLETQGAGDKFQQFGLKDFKQPVIFRVRKGNTEINEDMYVKYKSKEYIIKGIENVDLQDRELNIYCDED